jgi:hypothetical protein
MCCVAVRSLAGSLLTLWGAAYARACVSAATWVQQLHPTQTVPAATLVQKLHSHTPVAACPSASHLCTACVCARNTSSTSSNGSMDVYHLTAATPDSVTMR